MAGYSLIGSYSTVQVLSPQLVNDVVYCTIQTTPTGVIASIPIAGRTFDQGLMGPELTTFADNIETIVGRGHIIGGTGSQTIDGNGLLQDFVTFTVEYVPPGSTPTSITAQVDVPIGLLSVSDVTISETLLAEAEALVTAAYDSLQSAASG